MTARPWMRASDGVWHYAVGGDGNESAHALCGAICPGSPYLSQVQPPNNVCAACDDALLREAAIDLPKTAERVSPPGLLEAAELVSRAGRVGSWPERIEIPRETFQVLRDAIEKERANLEVIRKARGGA